MDFFRNLYFDTSSFFLLKEHRAALSRVIQEFLPSESWHLVTGNQNLTDCTSRDLRSDQFLSQDFCGAVLVDYYGHKSTKSAFFLGGS